MKSLFNVILLFAVAFSAVSCFQKDKRNYQYFPNMYAPVPYEPYRSCDCEGVFEGNQEAQLPVEGTIPRGWMPYQYENTNEGYEQAKAELKNPLPYTEENASKGAELYTIYCAICHGDKGDGKGTLATREKILGIPAYNDPGRALTEGSIYHVMYYGKNNMGSYAVQVNEKERWQIDLHVIDLKRSLDGLPQREYEKDNGQAKEVSLTMSEKRMNMPGKEKDFGQGVAQTQTQEPVSNETQSNEE